MKKLVIFLVLLFWVQMVNANCSDRNNYSDYNNVTWALIDVITNIWNKLLVKNPDKIEDYILLLDTISKKDWLTSKQKDIIWILRDYFICEKWNTIASWELEISWIPEEKKGTWYKGWSFQEPSSWLMEEIYQNIHLNPTYLETKDFSKDPFISLHQFWIHDWPYGLDWNSKYIKAPLDSFFFWMKEQFDNMKNIGNYTLSLRTEENLPEWYAGKNMWSDYLNHPDYYCRDNVLRYKIYIPKGTLALDIRQAYQWDWNSDGPWGFVLFSFDNPEIDYQNHHNLLTEHSLFRSWKTFLKTFDSSWQWWILLFSDKMIESTWKVKCSDDNKYYCDPWKLASDYWNNKEYYGWYDLTTDDEWWLYMTIFTEQNVANYVDAPTSFDRIHFFSVNYSFDKNIFDSWYSNLSSNDFNEYWDLYDKHNMFTEKSYTFCKQTNLKQETSYPMWNWNYFYYYAELYNPVDLKYTLDYKK